MHSGFLGESVVFLKGYMFFFSCFYLPLLVLHFCSYFSLLYQCKWILGISETRKDIY